MTTTDRRLLYDEATDTYFLTFPYETYLVTLIKQIGGAVWDAELKHWKVPSPSPVSAKQLLDLAELQHFEYDGTVLFKLTALITDGIQILLQSMADSSSFKIEGLKQKPYPFQVAGIEFAINRKRVIIGDQMGLGKTIQSLGVISHLGLYPAIVVCPAIVKLNWQREILAWVQGITPENICTLSGRTPHELPKALIYIINYDVLQDWADTLLRSAPKCVVFDEIHYIKTGSSKRGRAARKFATKVEYIIGLSGTPILNRPAELINPLRSIGRLGDIGGQQYFERRYCTAHRDVFGRWNLSGATNLKELNDRLRTTGIFIRRLKQDVLSDLPRKLPPTIIPIELTNKADYIRAERDLAKWLGERAVEDEKFKASIAHLLPMEKIKVIAGRKRTVEYLARRNEELRRFTALKRLSTIGKFNGIKEHVNNFLQSGEKLVLFGWFVDTQRDLVVEWPHSEHVLGSDNETQRYKAIDKFQDDPDCKLLIASLKVLGIGANLTAAHHVAFAELGWTPADHDQAEDRLHRIGQKFPVNVYYYIGMGTIEEEIVNIIDQKRRVIGAATDGLAATDDDIIRVLIGKLIRKYKHND